MMRVAFLFLVVWICQVQTVLSQEDPRSFYPAQFTQYMNAFMLVNPSSICLNSDFDVSLGSQRLGRKGWDNISTYFANGAVSIQGKNKNAKNVLGIKLIGDKEGPFLRRNWFYLTYAWQTRVSKDIWFSGGLEFGGMNFSAKSSYSTTTFSSSNIDGGIGACFFSDKFYLGFSISQMLNSELQPLDETAQLYHYYNFSVSRKIEVSPVFYVEPSYTARILVDRANNFDGGITATLDSIFLFGLSYRALKGMVFFVGLRKFPINTGVVDITISYNTPLASQTYNVSTYELTLHYAHSRKKMERLSKSQSLID